MREIAVSGSTAHPALAAEICADLGVRCAASQARKGSTSRPSGQGTRGYQATPGIRWVRPGRGLS